jgi:hypothetical protein
MEKNYLKRKKRRQGIIRSTIFLLIVLILLNYVWLYLAGFYEACSALVLLNVPVALMYLSSLGVKFPRKRNPDWLDKERLLLEKKYRLAYDSISERKEKSAKLTNSHCPKCRKSNVIDKIRRVKGDISGNFKLGFGSVSGKIDTNSVNTCSSCGHEWIKEEIDISETTSRAISEILSPIYDFFIEGKDNDFDELKNLRAKSVKRFIDRYNYQYKAKELSKLTIKDLRKYGCK